MISATELHMELESDLKSVRELAENLQKLVSLFFCIHANFFIFDCCRQRLVLVKTFDV